MVTFITSEKWNAVELESILGRTLSKVAHFTTATVPVW
jgi:hypothetical protein